MLTDNLLIAFIVIFILRVADVSLGTLRMIYTVHGRKLLATGIGFVEVTIFIYAISQVVASLKDPVLMLAYSGGFATGTFIGLSLEERFAMGYVQLRIISRERGEEIAKNLWENDLGATVVPGHGRDGLINLVFSVVRRRFIPLCLSIASRTDPASFVSVSDSRQFFRGHMGHPEKRK